MLASIEINCFMQQFQPPKYHRKVINWIEALADEKRAFELITENLYALRREFNRSPPCFNNSIITFIIWASSIRVERIVSCSVTLRP
jgi:hypothetical protein